MGEMKRRIKQTQQQVIMDECVDAREYFYRVYEAQQNGEEWAMDIPVDSIVYYADQADFEKLRFILK